jgi:hypothetical protein
MAAFFKDPLMLHGCIVSSSKWTVARDSIWLKYFGDSSQFFVIGSKLLFFCSDSSCFSSCCARRLAGMPRQVIHAHLFI